MPVADFAGTPQLGLRRRLPVRAVAKLRPARRSARLRRCRARARARRHPRRRLQPPRARGRLPDAVQSGVPHRPHTTRRGAAASTSMGRARMPCGASSSTTRCHWITRVPARRPAARRDARARRRRADAHRGGDRGRGTRGRAVAGGDSCRGSPQPRDARRCAGATAAGGSTASGPTTSITSCAAAWPATGTATTRTTPDPIDELARTLRQGWLFTGQHSAHGKAPRGTDPSHLPMHRFVVCLQNHDQIGNRATGERLHHSIDAPAWRAASTLLLTSPMTPLLFMGQEWAASSPFQYFTDLEPGLGALVTEGRRREFEDFPEFTDPAARAAHSRSAGCGNVRAQHARLERARTAGARAVAGALHRAAATAEHAPRARCNGKRRRSRRRPSTSHDRHAARRRRRAVPGRRPARGRRHRRASRTTKRQCPPWCCPPKSPVTRAIPQPIEISAGGRQRARDLPPPRRRHIEVLNERDSITASCPNA